MGVGKGLRLGPVARLSFGLVALVVGLLVGMDLIFDVMPDRQREERHLRQRFAESLAVQVASLTEAGNEVTLKRTLQQVVTRNPGLLSVAMRQSAGYIVAQQGDHARHWAAPESGRSTLDQVRVPIMAGNERWGHLELAFASVEPSGLREWIMQPAFLLLGGVSVGGILLFYPYLRRALHFLDPSTAVPDRVRKAFDALTSGVIVIDPQGRIMLANRAFRLLHPEEGADLHGRSVAEIAWLSHGGWGDAAALTPWARVLQDGKAVTGNPLSIPQPDGGVIETLVGSSPISDNDGRVRGCLVTFDDVTELHQTNERLRSALTDLERSREQIQAQNEELQRLATRDPLTGCLNRRAFFADGANMFEGRLRNGGEMCCIMADIDHFKSFNDLYGHAVGDQVIQVVAKALSRMLRPNDLLCRYGGEEFTVLLPDVDQDRAASIAERLRAEIEEHARSAVRSTRVERITSSFGVASMAQGAVRLEELIDQADNALYKSKEAGRNRVTVWVPPVD